MRTDKVLCRLLLWLVLILAFSLWAPTPGPMKAYNTIGPLHYAALLLAPLGSWITARVRSPLWIYTVFGALCTLVFDLRLGHRWQVLVFLRRTTPLSIDIGMLCAVSIGLGLLCRSVANRRQHMERALANSKGLCQECSYDLTGNISGICPECGTAIRAIPADSGSKTPT